MLFYPAEWEEYVYFFLHRGDFELLVGEMSSVLQAQLLRIILPRSFHCFAREVLDYPWVFMPLDRDPQFFHRLLVYQGYGAPGVQQDFHLVSSLFGV